MFHAKKGMSHVRVDESRTYLTEASSKVYFEVHDKTSVGTSFGTRISSRKAPVATSVLIMSSDVCSAKGRSAIANNVDVFGPYDRNHWTSYDT